MEQPTFSSRTKQTSSSTQKPTHPNTLFIHTEPNDTTRNPPKRKKTNTTPGQVLPATAELCATAIVPDAPSTTPAPAPSGNDKDGDDKDDDKDDKYDDSDDDDDNKPVGSSIPGPAPTASSTGGVQDPVVTGGAATYGAGLGIMLLGAAVAL